MASRVEWVAEGVNRLGGCVDAPAPNDSAIEGAFCAMPRARGRLLGAGIIDTLAPNARHAARNPLNSLRQFFAECFLRSIGQILPPNPARRGMMRCIHVSTRLAFALAMAGLLPSAPAAPVTVNFSGTFSQVQGAAPASLAGAVFAGALVFDPAAGLLASTATTITYVFGSAQLSAQTGLGSGQSLAGQGNFGMAWDSSVLTRLHGTMDPADQFGAGANATFAPGLSAFTAMSVQLVDDTAAPADDPLGAPLSPPPTSFSLASFEAAEFSLIGVTPSSQGGFLLSALAVGNISCLSTDAGACALSVPEPGTLVLLSVGLAAFAATRRRGQSRRFPIPL